MKKNKARDRLNAVPKLVSFAKLNIGTDYKTRKDLFNAMVEQFGDEYTDREMRRAIQAVRYDRAIVADPSGAGYRFARHSDTLSNADLEIESRTLRQQIATFNKRIESEKMALRPLIAHLAMLKKAAAERSQDKPCIDLGERYTEEYDCEG